MTASLKGALIFLSKHPSTGLLRLFGIAQAIVLSLTLCSAVQAQTTPGSGSSSAVASVVSQKHTARTNPQDANGQKVAPNRPASPPRTVTSTEPEAAGLGQIQPSIEAEAELKADDGSQEMMSAPPEGEAMLRVRISVPHQTRPVSSITLYPYPPRPPRMIRQINKLDDKPKSIRNQLLNLGYSNRSSDSRLFPTSGWRWQYILRAALQKSGTRPPTNIITMYPWTHKMVPYVQAEVRRINEIEADRLVRYQSTVKDFEENGIDLENEAMQKGLAPIEINLRNGARKLLSGEAAVSPGTWYIVAAHKTSNLNFFWQIPVTLSAGEKSTVQLTQTNALVIEGGW
jgi:hypothetical protein